MGQRDSALAVSRRYTATPAMKRFEADAFYLRTARNLQ